MERCMDTRFADIVQLEVAKSNTTLVAIENAPGMVSVVLMTPGKDISVDELESVSRAISHAFIELYGDDYLPAFEVTSPGLDRVLKTQRELELFAGRFVRVTIKESREPIIGILGVSDGSNVHVMVLSLDRAFELRQVTKISLWDEILGGAREG
jgi:ribosome maturation factor RimP